MIKTRHSLVLPRLRLPRILLLLLSLPAAVGCFGWRPSPTPMPSQFFAAPSADVRGLVVFIPGMGDGPDRYQQQGFVQIVQRTNPHFDVVTADAHFGYFRNFRVLERVHLDVIEPIVDRYEEIWIVGISIGGLVATTYAMEHANRVTGTIVLAPYLGSREIIEEVRDAGGLDAWSPPDLAEVRSFRSRHYYRLWSGFKERVGGAPALPRLLIGVGDRDGLRGPSELLAEHLPTSDYEIAPGGHDWATWTVLFEVLIRRGIEERRSGAEALRPEKRRPDASSPSGRPSTQERHLDDRGLS